MRGRSAFSFALLLLLLIPIHDTLPGSAKLEYEHAWRLFVRGDLTESQQEAALGYRQFQVSDPAWAAKFQLLEAESMLKRGMYDDALRTVAAYRGTDKGDDAIRKLTIEAIALTRQDQLPVAAEKLAQAENMCAAAEFTACGEVLSARAILAAKYGQLAEERQLFLKALSFARDHHDAWLEASATLNLGYFAIQVNHFDEAVDWSQSAYREATTSGYENVAQIAEGNLGWAYFQLGDDERALEHFLAAEKSAEQHGNVRSELGWDSTIGYVYRDSGDLNRASHFCHRALDLARQINSREDIVHALEDLAQISELSGKLDDASSYIDQVVPMEATGGTRLGPNLLLTEGMLAADRHQDSKAKLLFRSLKSDSANPLTVRLSAGFEMAKLTEVQGNTKSAEQMYRATLAAFDSARAQLKNEESQLPFGANAIQIYDRYVDLLLQQGRVDEALAVADQSRARTLEQNLDAPGAKKIVDAATLNSRKIAQSTNSTLLFYWLGEKQSYLWAITPSRIALVPLPAQQEIAARVVRYRQTLLDVRDPIESSNPDGQQLYQILVAPAAKLIRPGAQVIILADGILSQLNFETLLVPGPGPTSTPGRQQQSEPPADLHYLLDDLTLSSAPSLDLLAEARPAPDKGQRMLLFGNPVSSNQDFPTLPMFSYEMARIESHFPPAQLAVFTGEQATPAAYLASQPQRYSYIHFVSHAVASRTNPLDSAIILSNSTTGSDSYKLYARDIIHLPIDARLVTISACYGTGTRAYAGEGLVGLSWAFLRAGAQQVVGALWEVSDDSTPLLMDSLYQGLAKGDSPAVALRHAKLSLLHSQSRFREPFYWAPFQIYGRR